MWRFSDHVDKVAVVAEDGKEITYAELQEASLALKRHIPERCLLFVLCKNEIGSLLGYVTSIDNRIVPLLVDANLEKGLLARLIETYKPDFLWLPENRQAEVNDGSSIYSSSGYVLIKTSNDKEHPLHGDLALLLTTSGSTGSPKMVRISYKNIEANMISIAEYLELNEDEKPITTLPMSYSYGLSIINSHLHVGAPIILTSKTLMQKEFWQQLKELEATSFGGVPYTYEMLNKLRFFRMDFPTLRYLTQAGGRLSLELHKKFAEYAEEKAKRFVVMYGQTEATARMAYLPPDRSLEKCGSMGIAIPGGKLSIFDADGNCIDEEGVVGELVYEGANVTLGYAECGEDLIKGDERNGILATGDMAKRDADGFFYIVGRKRRFLKIYGNRVNLDEVERLINTEYEGMKCACAGTDDSMYVFITDDKLVGGVKRFIADKTGLYHAAFKVKHIEVIPKNDAGKTLYGELEDYYD